MNLEKIQKLAETYGWDEIDHQENISMISFYKILDQGNMIQRIFQGSNKATRCRLNIYYTTMTVGTSLNHPKKGKTQLFRKDVSEKMLKKIFQNPRVHTGTGYYTGKTI